jgi:hypothetical protein
MKCDARVCHIRALFARFTIVRARGALLCFAVYEQHLSALSLSLKQT